MGSEKGLEFAVLEGREGGEAEGEATAGDEAAAQQHTQ